MLYKHLMSPYGLGKVELRNRLVMAPMLSRLCDANGVVSQKLIDYYAARARGASPRLSSSMRISTGRLVKPILNSSEYTKTS